MTNRLHLALASLTALLAGPAFACGGGVRLSHAESAVLSLSMMAAPLLAALLVDRGAFALAAYAMGLKRRHQPSALGPMVAVASVVIAVASFTVRDYHLGIVGLALVPFAAGVCSLSLLRSLIIDMRGDNRARAVRVAGIAAFVALALAFTH